MSDGWRGHDPFGADDPASAAREQRRREREERRQRREEKKKEKEQEKERSVAAQPASPDPPPPPPQSAEEEFWGEEPPPPPPPMSPKRNRRSPWGILLAAIAVLAAIGLAVVAYVYLTRDEPPPPEPLRTITATIPEGYSRAQTAELARELKLKGDYEKATIRSRYLDPAEFGGAHAKNLEGFLFPDTFELDAQAPVSDLVQDQLEDFKRRIAGVDMSYAKSKNLTVYDVITIASMVEKEAQLESERKLISAVIYNRLRDGIPLGIDATIRYAENNWTRPLRVSELERDGPYNTRLRRGLPPTPIGNPGLASLRAAAHPSSKGYLFYVRKPGKSGEHAFSSTDAQFERDVKRYQDSRQSK
jgi:UPF0755 protein